ncbi:shewanella-like protein phosphatase 1 [Rutidosis leptorrhynchoides]|uniref:shewanella-like protein phosphatase 1 n=1 Tax=Rutidosis leptorrhynchoides TaxID=125765 RepID=UPI003A99268C
MAMASLSSLNSLPMQPPSRKLIDSPSPPTSLNFGSSGNLKPIVISGDPPTFVSAPGRRIVAVGDLHGDLAKARGALELAGVLSSDGQDTWTGQETVLVQLGDILDRGEDEIAILSLLRSLQIQAKEYGGAVFQVNGNHETMNVEGDFRYVDSGAFDECSDFLEYLDDCGHNWEDAFESWSEVSESWKEERKTSQSSWGPWNLVKRQKGVIARSILLRPGGPLASELARHPVVLKVDDWVFCHGGLLPHHVTYGIEKINSEVSKWMINVNEDEGDESQIPFIATRGYDSVVWNRLYSRDTSDLEDHHIEQIQSVLDTTLQVVGAKAMVVGHTPQTTGVNCKYNCSIWRVDVGMSSGVLDSRPEVLEIRGNKTRVIRSESDSFSELQAADYI